MTEVTCRLLSPETEVEIFRTIRLRALKAEPFSFLDDYEESLAEPPENFARYFKNCWIACAFIDGEAVGLAGLHWQPRKKVCHKGTVWGVWVDPKARGKGIARKLITLLLEKAKEAGLELVQISTDETNPVTLGLYQSLGFEEYGREKNILKVDTHYVTDVWMVKFL
jgi:ribosomal protein S18 acetylase RimI-like enzyme